VGVIDVKTASSRTGIIALGHGTAESTSCPVTGSTAAVRQSIQTALSGGAPVSGVVTPKERARNFWFGSPALPSPCTWPLEATTNVPKLLAAIAPRQ
jgi:hypothetical protein